MRNAVFAAISLAVALVAAVLALLYESEPTVTTVVRTVAPTSTPAATSSITTARASPTPRATPLPRATPTPPPATPTPPSPGVLTLTPAGAGPPAEPLPDRKPAIRYGTLDATGEAAAPGSYALLLTADGVTRVVTTYEELRTETALARFNVTDAADAVGTSRAERFDAVAVGDLIEWRQAEDCWVRFQVTSTPAPTPETPVREFGVEWMTYAFTGCAGAIAADVPATVDLGPLPDLGNPSLAYPIRHGPWQLVPPDWTGAVEEREERRPPWRYDRSELPSTTLFHARQLTYWRDPALPVGWTLQLVERESASPYQYGYRATYGTTTGVAAFTISASVWFLTGERAPIECSTVCHEARVIAGRPARVSYSPSSPFNPTVSPATVRVYDAETDALYVIRETDHRFLGGRIDDVVDIARSLFDPQPDEPGVLRYGHLDSSRRAEEPGSYAFTTAADRAATVVTTFEGLRDGSATGLLVHTSDVDGVSHDGLFDTLEAGDRFEWRRADACWVRYRVTDVLPDPAGAEPRKLLGVQWETYAFTGCRGEMPASAYATFDFNALPDLGGTSLDAPVVHGPWQLVPEDWDGVLGIRNRDDLGSPGPSHESVYTSSGDMAVAEARPEWAAPALPPGWKFAGAFSGPLTDITAGSCVSWDDGGGRRAVEICESYRTAAHVAVEASSDDGALVREFRTIGSRLALVTYSPLGPNHDAQFRVEVSIHDAATETTYTVFAYDPTLTGANVDAVIAIARSLFEPRDSGQARARQ